MIKYSCQNYVNRWVDFPERVKEMMNVLFPEETFEFINTTRGTDICFLAPYNAEPLNLEIPNCYIIHENILSHYWDHARYCIKNLNLPYIGYVRDDVNSCEYPHWLYKYKDISSDNKFKQNKIRENKVCSVIRNHRSEDRENIVKFYNSEQLNNEGDWGTDSKFELIYKYYYNLAIESTYMDYYISEKVYDAVIAGCIPIYKGGNLSKTILNENRIIDAYDELPKFPKKLFELPILKPKDIVEEMINTRKKKLREFILKILNSKK